MMLIFDDFYLPNGTKMFVYSLDKTDILGAFTSDNNTDQRKFSTTPLKTNSIIIEYYQPAHTKDKFALSIMSVGLIGSTFSQVLNKNFGTSGSCMINAMCPDYDDWCNQRRSVALIIRVITGTGMIRWCSGSLLTNERRDGKPIFLTAFHCIDNNSVENSIEQSEKDEIQNWVFIFNYQSPDCPNPSIEPSLMQSITGATYINSHYESDYALLQLNQRPPQDYNVFYNGWSNDSDDMTETGVCIHHPDGDIKKISEWEKKFTFNTKHWKVEWTAGSTEGGSSGAPLFNSSGYVVGQNHYSNGEPVCDDDKRNFFGRFDKSWHNYGLSWILNPNGSHSGSNQYYISRMNGDETCKDNWYFASGNDLHTSNNVSFINPSTVGTRMYNGVYNAKNNITAEDVTIQSGTTVRFVAGESITLKPGFHAEAGSNFTASIGDCLQNCNNGFKKSNNNNNLDENGMQIVDSIKIRKKETIETEKQLYFYDEIIKIYPNPNTGDFVIEIPLDKKEVSKVTIINQLGQIVYQSDFNSTERINLLNPKAGIYFVSVTTNNKVFTQKIIIR